MKQILVFALKSSLGDCTAHGATSIYRNLTLFSADSTNEEIEDYCMKNTVAKNSCLRVVVRENPIYGNYAEVVFKKPSSAGTYMFGGNYVVTSDSRYSEIVGMKHPLSVHDRFESWEMHEHLSK